MIVYDPSKVLKRVAPEKQIKKLVSPDLKLKRAALTFVEDFDFLSKKAIATVALKAIRSYKKRSKEDSDLKKEFIKDPALLIQRVQNAVVFEITQEIRGKYLGESYRWLPSDADEPDPEHQLNYGKVFQIDEGEMPGDRPGCRCGMEILVEDSTLDL